MSKYAPLATSNASQFVDIYSGASLGDALAGPDSFSGLPALPSTAGQTRTSGLPGVVQGVISRRPSVRAISVDRMSYKNASAKQTHD